MSRPDAELVFRLRLAATAPADMLAVEFITTADVALTVPWVRVTADAAVIDWPLYERLEHGWMSRRELAVWTVAHGLAAGDLQVAWWDLDARRRRALIAALAFWEHR